MKQYLVGPFLAMINGKTGDQTTAFKDGFTKRPEEASVFGQDEKLLMYGFLALMAGGFNSELVDAIGNISQDRLNKITEELKEQGGHVLNESNEARMHIVFGIPLMGAFLQELSAHVNQKNNQ